MTGTQKQTVVIKAAPHRTCIQPRSRRASSPAYPAPRPRALGPGPASPGCSTGLGGVWSVKLRAAPTHGTKQGRHAKFHNFKMSCCCLAQNLGALSLDGGSEEKTASIIIHVRCSVPVTVSQWRCELLELLEILCSSQVRNFMK